MKIRLVIFFLVLFISITTLYLIRNILLSDLSKRISNEEISYISYIKISSVGDIFLHESNIKTGKTKTGYDFSFSFEDVAPVLRKSDITTCWLGAVYDTIGPYTGYPLFKSPAQLLTALKESGFDIMLRTNHTMDYYEDGLMSTTELMKKNNLIQLGAFITKEESKEIYIIKKDSLDIALLSYTYGLNGLMPKYSWEVAMIDTAKIGMEIKRAAELSDFVIVFLHYGTEYSREPDKFQKRIARFCAESGAGIIIGSHPHVIEPIETILTKDNRIVYSAYSLGNFFCGQRKRYTDCGMILSFYIEKSARTNFLAEVKSISYTPTYVNKYFENGDLKYKIILADEFNDISDTILYLKIKESLSDTREILHFISGIHK